MCVVGVCSHLCVAGVGCVSKEQEGTRFDRTVRTEASGLQVADPCTEQLKRYGHDDKLTNPVALVVKKSTGIPIDNDRKVLVVVSGGRDGEVVVVTGRDRRVAPKNRVRARTKLATRIRRVVARPKIRSREEWKLVRSQAGTLTCQRGLRTGCRWLIRRGA